MDPAAFDQAALATTFTDYPIADLECQASDDAKPPEAFSYAKWADWQDSVITFLKGKKNVTKNIPLFYIIRKQPNPIVTDQMS